MEYLFLTEVSVPYESKTKKVMLIYSMLFFWKFYWYIGTSL